MRTLLNFFIIFLRFAKYQLFLNKITFFFCCNKF